MRRKISLMLVLALILAGCARTRERQFLPQRFEAVSVSLLPYGALVIVSRDNVLETCMANFIYNGVTSWPTPCDKNEFDKVTQSIKEALMEGMHNENR